MKTNDGKLFVIGGASRSGKTAWTVKQVRKFKRVIVWDAEDQWSKLPGFVRITSAAELTRVCSTVRGALKIAFVPSGNIKKLFNVWAGCVFYWGRYCGACCVVAEELADVSSPAKAPEKWGLLIRRGLKRGINIFAISQRWAEADKTAIGNASQFTVFRMTGDDVHYMAKKTRIPLAKLEGLQPLQFVTLDAHTGKASGVNKLRF